MYKRYFSEYRNSHNSKVVVGFTLIEILVVVTCIVILALIAIPDLFSAIERARIARLIHFESQVDHALGPALVGEWTFDDLTTNQATVKDLSTKNNDLTVCPTSGSTCAAASASDKCYPDVTSGQCVAVTGMGQCFDPSIPLPTYTGVQATDSVYGKYWLNAPSSPFLGVEGGKKNRTVGLWVKLQPAVDGTYPPASGAQYVQILVEKYQEYAIKLLSGPYGAYSTNFQIYVEYAKGNAYGDKAFFQANGVPTDNKWHYIVVAWENFAGGNIAVYLDGVKEKQLATGYADPPQASWGDLTIGRSHATGGGICPITNSRNPFYSGLMERVRIYNEALSI